MVKRKNRNDSEKIVKTVESDSERSKLGENKKNRESANKQNRKENDIVTKSTKQNEKKCEIMNNMNKQSKKGNDSEKTVKNVESDRERSKLGGNKKNSESANKQNRKENDSETKSTKKMKRKVRS